MVLLFLLRGLPLGRLSIIVIPKVSTIWLRNPSDPIGCHGRTASYLTAPAQIPACGTTALGSSEILASVKDKLVLPSLLFPAGRLYSSLQEVRSSLWPICFPVYASSNGYPFQCNTWYGWLARPYPTGTFTL